MNKIKFTLIMASLAWIATSFTAAGEPATNAAPDNLRWSDIRSLGVEGRGWNDTKSFYDRLPAKAETLVRPPVWTLSHDTAGMCVRFVTDATTLRARWAVTDSNLYMPNLDGIGKSGLDLYVKMDQGWRWLAVGKPVAQTNEATLVGHLLPGKREYLLYLPLYNGIQYVDLGIPTNAVLEKAPPWGDGERKPIVFYGTSILQGAAASRPGMVHSAILQRQFNWPVINLGFSGNGIMEPEVAGLLAELDPVVYVIDCLPNMTAAQVRERCEPLVRTLRAAHPRTPIVLVEDRTLQDAFLIPGKMKAQLKSRAELKAAFTRLQQSGVENLYYIPGEHLFGDDGEGSTDGSHPNDLGFTRQAKIFAEVLGPLLKVESHGLNTNRTWIDTNYTNFHEFKN
jgi:lysophospholipase L1-like esterase